ncbi:MAG TPA: hypothetical protein VHG92_01670, partial [Afifellaceae bacterium]|nr:hypothetical protein [Afifellaceae bacterium]
MSDNRRKQEGKSGAWTSPLNAVTDVLAAAWGTAVGIGCTVFGIKRPKPGGQEARRGGNPRPERPQTEASAPSRQQGGAAAKAEPPAKVAPVRMDSGRSAKTGAETTRRGARQAAPAKTGTAAKAPSGFDKGAPQRPAARRGRAAA